MSKLGAKVRDLRRREDMTQRQLAEKLGISSSYLNLIEHNRRPLPATLLIQLAGIFQVDLASFGGEEDDRLVSDLLEIFADPMFENEGLTSADLRELASQSPAVARAALTLYRNYRTGREALENLSSQMSDAQEVTGLPSEEVTDVIQRHMNYFPELEEGAEALWRDGGIDRQDPYRGLVRYLEQMQGVVVRVVKVGDMHGMTRRFVPERRLLMLSEALAPRSRNFQIAHQIGLLNHSSLFDRLAEDRRLTTPASRALIRVAMANYFAGAAIMPYKPFLEAAREERYDIEILGHRFRASFEQVAHRMTTLRRPGLEGVPFHFVRVDIGGNISKRFSASGMRFARFSGICSRWTVFQAFLTPGLIRVQLERMPDGTTHFCLARTLDKSSRGGYHAPYTVHAISLGCEVKHARELVYADGVNLENLEAAVPIGVTCRLCERMDCEQRAVPPIQSPMRIDENVRGPSFYAPIVIGTPGGGTDGDAH